MSENSLAAMLAAKRSLGVTPEVNLRECIPPMPLPSANKAAHSGFENRGNITKSPKTGVSGPTKGPANEKCKIVREQT